MSESLTLFITSFSALFAIMNPIAMTPFFISMTKGVDVETKKLVAIKATTVAFIIVSVFIVSGSYLFTFFGITIYGFKIFGGLLIVIVGLEMVQSKKPSTKSTKVELKSFDIGQAISPLGTPVLAGPGTIVTAINYVDSSNPISIGIVIVSLLIVCTLAYITFRASNYIVAKMGDNIIQVIAKVMGLIIGVMGVDMIVSGISLAFNI